MGKLQGEGKPVGVIHIQVKGAFEEREGRADRMFLQPLQENREKGEI